MNLSLALSLASRSYTRTAVDPDLAAFIQATGATNTESLSNLVTYLKAENLWTSSRIYPMRRDQNKGSGSVVYGLGGLTANNLSLVNSPAWGASGISYDGINQYGTIPDFLDSSTLTVWARWKYNSLPSATSNVILSQQDFVNDKRSWSLITRNDIAGDPLAIARSPDGGGAEVYTESVSSYSTSEQMYVAQWVDGGGRNLWVNKAQQSLFLFSASSFTSRFNADIPIFIAAQNAPAPGAFSDARSGAVAFLTGAVTTTQRETITDLINALGSTGDADLDAYIQATGATNVDTLFNLVTYLKQENLWSASRLYPMRSDQNKGSGATVFGLGGLSTENVSLVSSPTWTPTGVSFDGSTQYGLGPDLVDGSTMMVFSRNNVSTTSPGTGGRALLSTYGGTTNRAFNLAYNYDVGAGITLLRSPSGTPTGQEVYRNESNSGVTGVDACVVAEWINGGGRNLWINNAVQPLILGAGGTPVTSMFDSTLPLCIAARYESPTADSHTAMTGIAQMVVRATVTPTQRTALTNLINALGTTGDSDLDAYVAASGATDTEPLFNLVTYLKQQSLWASSRIYPMKAAQNAGSGSIAYGLGGLTSNNMTLVSSPTWGASGIAYNGTDQYGTIPDFLGTSTLTVFNRLSHGTAPPASIIRLYGQGDSTLAFGSIALSYAGNAAGTPYRIYRTSIGQLSGGVGAEVYDTTDEAQTTASQTLVNQWVDGGGRSMWQNKTLLGLTFLSGTPQTSKFNTTAPFIYSAVFDNGALLQPSNQTGTCLAAIEGTITATQREAITDLINAL